MAASGWLLLDIRAGQYANLWIPSISFWSFLQTHPFTIASWSNKEGVTSLDLLIDSRKGLTQNLYACAEYYRERPGQGTDQDLEERASTAVDYGKYRDTFCQPVEQGGSSTAVDSQKSKETLSESIELKRASPVEGHEGSPREGVEDTTPWKFGYQSYEGEPQRSDYRLTIFSGPHGTGIPVGDYGKVLMIAAGFGIAAQLPYLKESVSGFNNYQVRTREIRLIWQLQSFGKYLGSGSG